MMRKLLCVLLSFALLSSSPVLASQEGALEEGVNAPAEYMHDGHVTLIDGALVDTPIESFEDAEAVVDMVLDRLGGDEKTVLNPWRTLTDAVGNQYYVFQQMYDNTTVLGGAVKVMTDKDGQMIGLTSSIKEAPADIELSEVISAEEAEDIVLKDALERKEQELHLIDGMTSQMILPVALEVDIDAPDEEIEGSRFVWVVYSDNPDSDITHSSDLPYLAHYVTLNGEYLYSLPTIMPGDEAGSSGFGSSYVFEFMESVNYTGYVDLSTGGEKEISVDVMRDTRTGMYYLGNLERRIVVADCFEFLYNNNRVVLESSRDNLYWDQVGLLTLYNYCRAYDYYKEIGWIGGDGLGTPILVLNDYCDANHKPVNNAAYVGGFLGWQIFLASRANDFSQCLDVLAHEFTHCVTGSAITYNLYRNDHGSINEALSDIQGKTCQMMMDGRENVSWVLGDMSRTHIRDMAEPHHFTQPEFSWDLYYIPYVKTPTTLNDQGGVHSNSSLLNHLAYLLYEEGAMTLEEGRIFWFTVDCAMVPGTDYPQMAELLPWALKACGMEGYEEKLQSAIEAIKLGVKEVPTTFEENRAFLTLALPENEIFDDEQWIMLTYVVNVEKLSNSVMDIVSHLMAKDYDFFPSSLRQILEEEPVEEVPVEEVQEEKGFWDTLADAITEAFAEKEEEPVVEEEMPQLTDIIDEEVVHWLMEHFREVFVSANTNTGQDGHTMRTMVIPGNTVSVLVHGIFNMSQTKIEDTYLLILLGNRWYDLTALMDKTNKNEAGMNPLVQQLVESILEGITSAKSIPEMADCVFYHVQGGKANELPIDGLEDMKPMESQLFNQPTPEQEAPEAKMSRPKLEEPEATEEVKAAEEVEATEEVEAAEEAETAGELEEAA